jgi:lipopolysaccharide export system protein LptA
VSLKSWLNDSEHDQDSRLNHAIADGKVDIVQITPERNRLGKGDHAEYYTDEGKIILSGTDATMTDTLKGTSTKADKLTYFTDDDKLILVADPKKQVKTHLVRKKRT